MPADSRVDLWWSKCESISNSGSTSEIMYLRGEEVIVQEQTQPERTAVRICETNSPAATRVSEGGRFPVKGAEIPMQSMKVHRGAEIHLQSMEDPTPEEVDVPEGICHTVGSSCWSRLLTGPVDLWR
ncbi:protein pxr1-like [Willisornis vidua]|uniref:Protein pxr1-like n=1 Tax=Willisornis vidua TaxID=1566151 RepID=A0ABQ9CXT5_9PASS|nr:protein pxr1-like [Willisornis vidua]